MGRCPWVNEDIFKRKGSLTDMKIKAAKYNGVTVFFFLILKRFIVKGKKGQE